MASAARASAFRPHFRNHTLPLRHPRTPIMPSQQRLLLLLPFTGRRETRRAVSPYCHSQHSGSEQQPLSGEVDVAHGSGNPASKLGTISPSKRTGGFVFLGRRLVWRRIFLASKKIRSILLLNVLIIIYASNIPVLKEIEAVTDPALFNMVRFTGATVPFLPFMIQAKGDAQTLSKGLELGCWVTLGYLAQALGLLTSDAGRASFLSAFTVIVVPLMDFFLGASIPALTWPGAIISLIGVSMLESSGSPSSVGDILNLLSALFFGIHMLRTEHITRTTKKEKVFALLGYEVSVVALFSIIWYLSQSFYGDTSQCSSFSWKWNDMWSSVVSFPWIPSLYTGIFSTGLCLWAEMYAMRNVSATETAIIYGLEPLWGASFAWFLLGERWDAIGWLGAALVLGGSMMVQIFASAPEQPKKKQESSPKLYNLSVDKRNDLSLSTVVIRSKKDVSDLVKKHDKL